MLHLCKSTYGMSKCVVLGSGLCIVDDIKELRTKWVFSDALITKQCYWWNYINGEEIKEHCATRPVNTSDA